MGFSKVIIVLNIALSFLVSSSVSHKIWVQETTHNEQVHNVHHAFPTLPKKLKHHDEETNVKTVGNKHYFPFKMKEEEALPLPIPGKLKDRICGRGGDDRPFTILHHGLSSSEKKTTHTQHIYADGPLKQEKTFWIEMHGFCCKRSDEAGGCSCSSNVLDGQEIPGTFVHFAHESVEKSGMALG